MNIQTLRADYATAQAAYETAKADCDRAREALDKALVEANSHRIGTTITLTNGKKFRIDRVTGSAGRVLAWGVRELATGGWAKRSTNIQLNTGE